MKILKTIIFMALMTSQVVSAQNEARLMRFPSIHGNNIAFSYAGDIYTVSKDGGMARRITSGSGYEIFPRFSPDGKHIAFTAQYDGNTEVYLIPSEGGVPKRLTHTATLNRDNISDRMGPNNIVMCWTPDGKNIIYRSRKQTFNDFIGQLFSVPIDGGMSVEIPLSTGGFCSFSPDGSQLAFNRVFREFRTWKYYKGGMADDIRIFDTKTKKITKICDNVAQDIMPMWIGKEIFYISDRDRTMNIFAYNTENKQTTKVSTFSDYDIKYPSHDQNSIVFENGGYIYIMDAASKKISKVNIQIANDFVNSRNFIADASKNIESVSMSPAGERLVVSARGEIFSIPTKSGVTRNLTKSSNAHDRNAVWSPDGKYIAWLSDKSGEYEIWMQKQDGSEKAVQITSNSDTYPYFLKWSPDSKKIAWSDKKLRLRFVDVNTKKITEISQNLTWEYSDFEWSPDSKWITYTDPQKTEMNQIKVFNTETLKTIEITDTWFSSNSPAFSRDGKYLVFISSRDFNPTYSYTEWNHAYTDMERIYILPLTTNTPNPLRPDNNEVNIAVETNTTKKDNKKEETSISITIDENGLKDRIVSLPIEASSYWGVEMIDNNIYYMRHCKNESSALFYYNTEDQKETKVCEANGFELSADGKKTMIAQNKDYYIVDLPKSEIKLDKKVPFNNMKVEINRQEEWSQIYFEAWRQMRDFFYVENMHGTNWNLLKDKYSALLPYVNNRHDLNYIIGELIGELSVGHAYINDGDQPKIEKVNMGLLGAKISSDASGYFKIDKILKGANWNNKLRSPLTEQGVDAKEGNYIISIDGVSAKDVNDIFTLLKGKANTQIEMTINTSASENGARKVIVIPIADESALYYYNWVSDNIEHVTKATNGEVGYIHIPDMGVEGLNEFVKYFYPQLDKKALIIDDRGNGGGNVSPMIIERLMREATRANMSRNVKIPGQTPEKMMIGPKVLLLNQYSASDGDLFPYGFKKHNIGKTIGVRSWGGVVGIRGSLPFVDGTTLNKPEFASYSIDESKWIIEGHGVDPDIIVDNDPYEEYMGKDAQLDKAIEVAIDEMKNYKPIPEIPVAPDKSK